MWNKEVTAEAIETTSWSQHPIEWINEQMHQSYIKHLSRWREISAFHSFGTKKITIAVILTNEKDSTEFLKATEESFNISHLRRHRKKNAEEVWRHCDSAWRTYISNEQWKQRTTNYNRIIMSQLKLPINKSIRVHTLLKLQLKQKTHLRNDELKIHNPWDVLKINVNYCWLT